MGVLLLLTGDDAATIAEEAHKAVEKLVGKEPDDFALEVFRTGDDRDALTVLGDLIGSVMTPPFLGGDKTVWLQNFGEFESEATASAKNPSPLAKALARLAEVISAGLPEDVNLILSGPDVDAKKALAAACKAKGKVQAFSRPVLTSRDWQREVERLLRLRADERGMRLAGPVLEYLVEVIGVDTGRLTQEVEKLYCYAGDAPTLEQAKDVCIGTREAGPFALSNAFGRRDLNEVMTVISQTLENTKAEDSACLVMTRQMGMVFRRMLHARLLMSYFKLRNPFDLPAAVRNMQPAEKEQYRGNMLFSMGDFQMRNVARDSESYAPQELLEILSWLADMDKLNVSSSLPRRLALETLALRIIAGQRKPAAEPATTR